MVHRYMRDNSHGLIIQVNFMVMCVYGALDPMVFLTKAQPSLMDGYYRMNIISGVGYPMSDLVVPLVYGSMQYLRHWYCTTVPRDSVNSVKKG